MAQHWLCVGYILVFDSMRVIGGDLRVTSLTSSRVRTVWTWSLMPGPRLLGTRIDMKDMPQDGEEPLLNLRELREVIKNWLIMWRRAKLKRGACWTKL